jgi:hypothetical protein
MNQFIILFKYAFLTALRLSFVVTYRVVTNSISRENSYAIHIYSISQKKEVLSFSKKIAEKQ